MSYVSTCNRTKAVLAEEARRCEVSKAEWVQTASRLPDETCEELTQALSLRLLRGIDANCCADAIKLYMCGETG